MSAMRRRPEAGERGSGLAMTAILTVVLLGMVATVLSLMDIQSKRTAADLQAELADATLDAAIGAAVMRVMAEENPPASVAGTMPAGNLAGGMRWAVTLRQSAADDTLWKLSAATYMSRGSSQVYRTAQAIIEKPLGTKGLPPVPPGILGAVTSHHPIAMHANLQISGNNHRFSDSAQVTDSEDPLYAQATYGLTTRTGTGSSVLNASNIQGLNGSTGTAATRQVTDVPNTPARVLSAATGGTNVMTDAELLAKSHVFNTEAEALAFLKDPKNYENGKLKNDKPIYFTFDSENNSLWAYFSGATNVFDQNKAYIFIHHRPLDGTEPASTTVEPRGVADLKNAHIQMKGIMIFDKPHHINGSSDVVGAMISMANSSVLTKNGNTYIHSKFGQGGTKIRYSTEAIGLALRDGLGFEGVPSEEAPDPRILSITRAPTVDVEVRDALQLCGMPVDNMSARTDTNAWIVPAPAAR